MTATNLWGIFEEAMAHKFSRRTLLTAAAGLTIFVRKASAKTEDVLKVVQWKHFVPEYDQYLTEFARKFSEKNKCRVEVEFIPIANLPATVTADIQNRSGHDVFQLNGTGARLHENVLADVTGISESLANEFGGWIPETHSIGKIGDKWFAVPLWFVRFPAIINRAYFKEVGEDYTDKTRWQDLLTIGAKLKKAGHPLGIPVAPAQDSDDALIALMLSFKAFLFDATGKVDLRRKEILEVLEFGKQLYQQALADDVLTWTDTSNNAFIASGKGALILNPISAYRSAAKENPEVFRNLEVVKTPIGPGGRANGSRTMSYGVFNFSKVQDLGREFISAMAKDTVNAIAASTGYNHPFLRSFTKRPMPVIGADPKLQSLQEFHFDVKFLGYPGPMTRTATAMYARHLVPNMFADVCRGKDPKAVVDEVEKTLRSL